MTPTALPDDGARTGEPTLETVERCLLCGSGRLELRFRAHDTLHGTTGLWGVVECGECGLMQTSPRPSRSAMASYYPGEYQPHAAHFAPTAGRLKLLRQLARRALDPKEVVIPEPDRPRDVLEVGCGSGRLLVELADRGWSVHGLEPSPSAVATLTSHRDLPVEVGVIEDAAYRDGSFDLILAFMVLEHLHDPLGDAQRLHRWLRPGGALSGSVPNAASWEFEFFQGEWFALQLPTHLSHFTPETLTRLLERAGFHRVRIHHQRNVSNLMIQLGRALQRRGLPCANVCLEYPERGSRTLRLAVRPLASTLAWLGQAGRISFVAERG